MIEIFILQKTCEQYFREAKQKFNTYIAFLQKCTTLALWQSTPFLSAIYFIVKAFFINNLSIYAKKLQSPVYRFIYYSYIVFISRNRVDISSLSFLQTFSPKTFHFNVSSFFCICTIFILRKVNQRRCSLCVRSLFDELSSL